MEEIIAYLAIYWIGVGSAVWYMRRPRKHIEEDRDAGIIRYQEYKDRKND